MRRAYYLNQWIHATDPELKKMIAGYVNLTASHKEAAELWLTHYRKVPRNLAIIPLSFILIEIARAGYVK